MSRAFYSGLSGKIALLFLLAFLVVILPLNTFIYVRLKSTLERADRQQLKAEGEKLLSQVSLDPTIIPLPASGYLIKIQTTDGLVLTPVFESPEFPELADAFFQVEDFDLDTLKILTIRQPMELGRGEILFTLARSNLSLQSQLADFRLYLFYITGFAVALIIVGVFAISGFMLSPVKRIIEASGGIASASEFKELPIPTANDESRELALALNAMLARIKSSNEIQQKFFDSATHELKTPLSIMKAELTQALETGERQDRGNVMAGVLEEVNRLERTISDFLLVSQLKNKMLSLKKDKTNVAELIYEIMKALNKFSVERRIVFSMQLGEGENFVINADGDKLKIIFFNILENAIRYSTEGEAVQIVLKRNNSGLTLHVLNKTNSPIFDIDRLGKERYTHSTSARGMGLGLWICNQIIELHGGNIQLKAGQSTFEVYLIIYDLTQSNLT